MSKGSKQMLRIKTPGRSAVNLSPPLGNVRHHPLPETSGGSSLGSGLAGVGTDLQL